MEFAAGEEELFDRVLALVCGFGGGLSFLGFLGQDLGFGLRFRVRMNVVVLVPGRCVGGEDGVPDDGLRGGFGGASGGVNGFEIEEDLFGVPVEKGGEIYVQGFVKRGDEVIGVTACVPVSRSNFTCAYSSFFML
jgi:hypothetical protein